MIKNSYVLANGASLFGDLGVVNVAVSSSLLSTEFLLISEKQRLNMLDRFPSYLDHVRSLGLTAAQVDAHAAVLSNLLPASICIGPGVGSRPAIFQAGSSPSGVASVPRLRKPGESLVITRGEVIAALNQWGSALGLPALTFPPNTPKWDKLASSKGPYYACSGNANYEFLYQSQYGSMQTQWASNPALVSFLPGFTNNLHLVSGVVGYGSSMFTGISYSALLTSAFGKSFKDVDRRQPYAADRLPYDAFLATFGPALFRAHQVWETIGAVSSYSDLLLKIKTPEVVSGVTYNDLDFTLGAQLYIVGNGGNLEYIRVHASSLSMTALEGDVTISLPATAIESIESDSRLAVCFGDVPSLAASKAQVVTRNLGTRARIATPYPLAGVDLANTRLWSYIDRGHDSYPEYVDSPENTVYTTVGGSLKLGDMRNLIPGRLNEFPILRSISVVSSRVGSASASAPAWGDVQASPGSYSVAIRKEGTSLMRGATFVKAIRRVDVPYLVGSGVGLTFPDSSNPEVAIKFDAAAYRLEIGLGSEVPFSEAFSMFDLDTANRQELDMEFPVATWVAQEGGFPNPADRLSTNLDEGIRYVHALNARDRTPLLKRAVIALGEYSTTIDVGVPDPDFVLPPLA